jgi:PAS domain-containing protein
MKSITSTSAARKVPAPRESDKKRQERLAEFSQTIKESRWDWNLVTNELKWDDGLVRVFGHRKAKGPPRAKLWYDNIHPGDRERVQESIREVIDGGGTHWADEYHFRRGDGSYAIVLTAAT